MNEQMVTKEIQVLLVEDNPGDVRLVQEALKEGKLLNDLRVVQDGDEALTYLRGEGEYTNFRRPDLIILDLNLPKKNGFEVLKEIKGDDDLRCIPVVILTTSEDEQDILKTYDYYANCYITKPIDFYRFIDVVKYIENFWFTVVKLPENH